MFCFYLLPFFYIQFLNSILLVADNDSGYMQQGTLRVHVAPATISEL